MTHWIIADWPAPAHIHAYTTLRTGGISQGEYSSLNAANHVQDNLQHVLTNRLRIKTMLKLPAEPVWLQQIHSVHAVCADQVITCPEADASYTTKKNTVCCILTADCLPILLCDQRGSMIAAIHGGWRGLLNGIIENTLAKISAREVIAWLGPAIGVHCFQVGSEVHNAFIKQSVQFSCAFKQQISGKYLANIYQIAQIILNNNGVQHIYGGDFCTLTDKQRFFSYRRDGQTGRMATLIWME